MGYKIIMGRFIDADVLIDRILRLTILTDDMYGKGIACGIERAANVIQKHPAADVVEVRHGEWKEDTEYYDDGYSECNVRKVFCCSLCGRTEKRREPYCNCGAKMDINRGVK